MTEQKEEWERLLDDSWQWHISHHLMFTLTIVVAICAVATWNPVVLVFWIITIPMYCLCVIRENWMISRAQRIRTNSDWKKESE